MALKTDISNCGIQCSGIKNDRSAGIIPRSYYWEGARPSVNLLIVSKNPGTSPDWEREIYARTPPSDLASTHRIVVHDLFYGARSVSSSYHVNLIRRVAAVMGVQPKVQDVFRKAALTALAKCESSGAKTAKIPDATYRACTERHLTREIEIFNHIYLLALGTEVFEFLTSYSVARVHGLPVGKLWHPSWSNMPGGEAEYFEREIPTLHAEYIAAVRASGREGDA